MVSRLTHDLLPDRRTPHAGHGCDRRHFHGRSAGTDVRRHLQPAIGTGVSYDPHPDGKRLLMTRPADVVSSGNVRVITRWLDGLGAIK